MVSIVKRMRKLKSLFHLRFGPGAAIFPSSSPISRLHLTYVQKTSASLGHVGARKFWRLCLPRIKFYNPAVGITVKHMEDRRACPALLSVYFAKPGAASDASNSGSSSAIERRSRNTSDDQDSFAPAPTDSENVTTLNVKDKDASEIWAEVRRLTSAQDVQPSETDRTEMEVLERRDKESEVDRQRVASIRQARKDQERMLKEAKEDVQKLRAD